VTVVTATAVVTVSAVVVEVGGASCVVGCVRVGNSFFKVPYRYIQYLNALVKIFLYQ